MTFEFTKTSLDIEIIMFWYVLYILCFAKEYHKFWKPLKEIENLMNTGVHDEILGLNFIVQVWVAQSRLFFIKQKVLYTCLKIVVWLSLDGMIMVQRCLYVH